MSTILQKKNESLFRIVAVLLFKVGSFELVKLELCVEANSMDTVIVGELFW